jgi:hypothetical protein
MVKRLVRRSARGLLLLCASSALFGCQPWSLPPKSEDALMGPLSVKRPLGQGALGKLVLQIDGSWALTREGEGQGLKLEQGQLIHIVRANGERGVEPDRHLMVVVAPRSWGAILQRLDARPIPENVEVYALPREDQGAVRFPGGCDGTGDITKDSCIAAAPAGTRWQVWPMTAQRTIPMSEPGEAGWRLEATRLSLVHRDVTATHVWEAAPRVRGERWLALPLPGLQAPAPMPLMQASGCGALSTELSTVSAGDYPADTHPLSVEARAYSQMVDGFVRCEGDEASGVGATLLRPDLQTASGVALGPAVLMQDQLTVPGGAVEAAMLADMLGALSRGDGVLADVFGERLLVRLGEIKAAEDVALRLAQLVAAAGRPEAALRLAQGASAGRWRRDGDVRWQLAQIAVWAALGRQREAASAQGDLDKLINRSKLDVDMMSWLYWRSVRDALTTGSQPEVSEGAADQPVSPALVEGLGMPWMLTLRLLGVLGSPARLESMAQVEREALSAGLEAAGASELWAAVQAGPARVAVRAEIPGPLDYYGRRLPGLLARLGEAPDEAALTSALVRGVGRVGAWPWTLDAGEGWSAPASVAGAEALSLMAMLSGDAASPALIARFDATMSDPALRGELCAPEGQRTLSMADPADAELRWLVRDGIALVCAASPEMLGEVEARLAQPQAGTPLVWSALRGWLLNSPADLRLSRLERAAQIAQARPGLAGGAACARLWMALAAAQIGAGQVESASAAQLRAQACPLGAEDRAVALELGALSWIVQRERSISDVSVQPAVRARLDAATRQLVSQLPPVCAELFDVQLTPDEILEPWTRALFDAVKLPPQPGEIMTASRMAKDAQGYVAEAAAALDRGDMSGAQAKLATARGMFERLGMEGAQRRLDLIAAGAATPATPAKRGAPAPQTGRARLKELEGKAERSPAERAQYVGLAILYHWADGATLRVELERAGACSAPK